MRFTIPIAALPYAAVFGAQTDEPAKPLPGKTLRPPMSYARAIPRYAVATRATRGNSVR